MGKGKPVLCVAQPVAGVPVRVRWNAGSCRHPREAAARCPQGQDVILRQHTTRQNPQQVNLNKYSYTKSRRNRRTPILNFKFYIC
jgi:hypothetical protein